MEPALPHHIPPSHLIRKGRLQSLSAKEFRLVGSRKRAFSAPALGYILPTEVRKAPSPLAFHKGDKTGWGTDGLTQPWDWVGPWDPMPISTTPNLPILQLSIF